MQYSLFTHGTALEIETPDALAGSIKVGWGTQIFFRAPVAENVAGVPVFPEVGPGSWFHIPCKSTLTTFGRRNPRLKSVTLLFESSHCRILRVRAMESIFFRSSTISKLAGAFLRKRNSQDINPEVLSPNRQEFTNTLPLEKSHRVFSAIGISFCLAFFEDFRRWLLRMTRTFTVLFQNRF
jgi:hypothetical protein